MKWDNDPYQYMKWDIYDSIVKGLTKEDSHKITIYMVTEAIDEMIDKLVGSQIHDTKIP